MTVFTLSFLRTMRPLGIPLIVVILANALMPGPGSLTAAQSPSTPVASIASVTRDVDVTYGEVDGEALLLDVYRPSARPEPRAAIIVIHGGGLSGGSRVSSAYLAEALAEAGYVTFNIEYRLFDFSEERYQWPAQLDDVQRAVRWVRANAEHYGVDPARVCAIGHSSGGHLAALLGVRDTRDNSDPALAAYPSRVTCVVDLAGDADLTDMAIAPDYIGILGGGPEEAPETYRDASPLFHVDAQTAPFLVVHGANDEFSPVEQARRLVAALQDAGVEVAYEEIPKGDHIIAGDWGTIGPFVLDFLERHLHPAN